MDFNKSAGQLEWMSISHEQMVQFICGKDDKKYLPWVFCILLEGMLMITCLFKILYAQTKFLSFLQVFLLLKRVIVIVIYAD